MATNFDIHQYLFNTIGNNDEDNTIKPFRYGKTDDSSKTNESNEITIKSLLMLESLNSLMRYIKPKQSYQYLLLDSANAIFSPDRSTMQWLINDGDPIARPNYINLSRSLKNIVAMRLGRVSWSSMDQPNTNIITNNHIGFGFSEFASQSLIMPSGPRLHFVQYNYDLMKTGNTITTSSFFENRGMFRFREKFTKLDTLTLSLWNLLDVSSIIIPDYYITINAIQYFKTTYVSGGLSPSLIDTTQFYTLPIIYAILNGIAEYKYPLSVMGEKFQFSGFTTNNPFVNGALIASYNSIHPISQFFPTYLEFVSFPLTGNPLIYSPIDISSAVLGINQGVPITITFLYKPRMVAALELITED